MAIGCTPPAPKPCNARNRISDTMPRGVATQRGADQEQASAEIEHLLSAVAVGKAAIDRNAHGRARR